MHRGIRARGPVSSSGGRLAGLGVALACLALSACGSGGSGDATNLLKQTFSGSHSVNSGILSLDLTVDPVGSSVLTGPLTLTFGGPFQSRGKGQLPQSDFAVSVAALGQTGSVSIISTGTTGYVTLKGTSYQLPARTFQKLESSFSQLASSPGGSGQGTLGRLGINPLRWLTKPSVLGTEKVGGADSTHIRAGVNVAALLTDVNTVIQRAASLGVSGASAIPSISPDTKARIAREVINPRVDVWTGTRDKTLRKLMINLTLPVSGQVSSLLGGLRSAAVAITMQYAELNQPQTIVAPKALRPFGEFAAKLQGFEHAITGALGGLSGGLLPGGAGSSGAAGATGSPAAPSASGPGSAAGVESYSRCIQAAGTDVLRMQRCASLLNGK